MHTSSGPAKVDFEELFGVNAGYVEKVYGEYIKEPKAVTEEWRSFFENHLPPEALASAATESAAAETTPQGKPGPSTKSKAGSKAGASGESDTEGLIPIRGIAARIAQNMAASLSVPTATSTRNIPVKVLEENRRTINQYLAAEVRGKASYTHIIAWAMVKAMQKVPAMGNTYVESDDKAFLQPLTSINIGMAVDLPGKDGKRSLVVPNIRDCGKMNFATFMAAFAAQIEKARRGKLTPADFKGTTATLTNPGTIGTISSLPRLMTGQAYILATGAITVPAEYQGASPDTLTELGISKVMTLTSTYDHRVIQGAESGQFLDTMHKLLIGEEGFYDQIFADLSIPYKPLVMETDQRASFSSPVREQQTLERAARVMQYIRAYRVRGYLLSNLDPLVYEPKTFSELEMDEFGLTIWDLDRPFFSGGVTKDNISPLRKIREVLNATYTRRIGVEYMHMVDPVQKEWLREIMESNHNEEELPREVTLRILDCLVEAEAFERFLHTRFVGHKRFSLEGGETLIPVLDALLNRAGDAGVVRGVIGMAHRGRLNVLAHIMEKSLSKIFGEFEGNMDPDSTQGSGDVKYHLGDTNTYRTTGGQDIELELSSNPSHLEACNPVVEGTVRARQEQYEGDAPRERILPILIHGDAAFSGQGVVTETLNMSQLHGYRTGGTVHIIVNNQIGYTTSPTDARSTPFCTDVAKAIQAPIFHVNGDDPLSAVRMVRLALDYRQKFGRDVVLDIVCYRRHGHNEGDEPSFTQPLLYRKIEAHPSVREIYQDYLLRAGVLVREEAEEFDKVLHERLRESLREVREREPVDQAATTELAPAPERTSQACKPMETFVDADRAEVLAEKLCGWPDSFTPHPKIEMLFKRRRQMFAGELPFDFATAEALAFAGLVTEGKVIRLAGQDSGRGTFSQRHAVLVNCETGDKHIPLQYLQADQAQFIVVDSFLSEEAALGFEFGYSVARPEALTLWEGQFGDFCNGAQIQIDQFIASSQAKWNETCNLTMLLPHGYDGQGPEHSSARLERFLQLVAEGNMRVANPSTAGQYFHLLRRQGLDPVQRPLIVMTPKSLLRQRFAGSMVDELTTGTWQPVIADDKVATAKRVVLCCGKVYYDLQQKRDELEIKDVAIVRVEQLAPWPEPELDAVLDSYGDDCEVVWCQEEPENMGAWTYLRHRIPLLGYAGRPEAASPATGRMTEHKAQQARLVCEALGI